MFLLNFKRKKIASITCNGFTLVELLVVVAIMFIMTSVVLFNYNRFDDNMLLNNFAYDLSLTIRQAQVYGVAVRENPIGGNIAQNISGSSHQQNFGNAYGVHFDVSSPSEFKLFLDSGGGADGIFQPSGASSDAVLNSYSFQRGIKIKSLCVNNIPSISGVCTPVSTLDISFLRPNPESRMYALDADGIVQCNSGALGPYCSSGTIVLQDAGDTAEKAVNVSLTGQISVQPVPISTP